MSSPLQSDLGKLRNACGWSQSRIAEMAGISRQSYAAIESGKSVPSTEVALRLARALGLPVERLFRLAEDKPGEIRATEAGIGPSPTGRVRLVRMGDRTVAYGLEAGGVHAGLSADGVVSSRHGDELRVRTLPERRSAPDLIVAGCDPAFGLVMRELSDRGLDVLWVPTGSEAALKALARGVVHVAGVHLRDRDSGLDNDSAIQRFVPFATARIGFAVWEQTLVAAGGNPLGIAGIEDLVRPDLRLVNREPGSGARTLLDSRLRAAGIAGTSIGGYRETTARGHDEVVAAVAAGTADAGIAVRASARARGLAAVTLAEEPYELAIPEHLLGLPAVDALLSVLLLPRVRSQVEELGGYDASEMGRVA
ncbi:MAG: substrate-binding domain-containing protein [Gemmatimonadota bacterium]